jgi:hypothetical protein
MSNQNPRFDNHELAIIRGLCDSMLHALQVFDGMQVNQFKHSLHLLRQKTLITVNENEPHIDWSI